MATAIYSSGNYVIVETDKTYEYAKGHTLYTVVDDVFYIKEITQGQFKIRAKEIERGAIIDELGNTYTIQTFTTFLRENTGL